MNANTITGRAVRGFARSLVHAESATLDAAQFLDESERWHIEPDEETEGAWWVSFRARSEGEFVRFRAFVETVARRRRWTVEPDVRSFAEAVRNFGRENGLSLCSFYIAAQ